MERREAPQEHTDMYIKLGDFSELLTKAPCTAVTKELVLVFIWKVLCLFRNHATSLSGHSSAARRHSSVDVSSLSPSVHLCLAFDLL